MPLSIDQAGQGSHKNISQANQTYSCSCDYYSFLLNQNPSRDPEEVRPLILDQKLQEFGGEEQQGAENTENAL